MFVDTCVRGTIPGEIDEYIDALIQDLKAVPRRAKRALMAKGVNQTAIRPCAVWLAEARVPMPEIAAIRGHSSSRVTEAVYAKYSPDYLERAIKALR